MPSRILKESICTSEEIDALTWFEEVLFYRLMVKCDDYGRCDGREKVIRGNCFPLKDVTAKDISKALEKLVAVGLVMRYTVGGKPYLQLSTWERHQQIRTKRSKFPAPEDADLISNDIKCNQMISDDIKCSRNPIQSNPIRNQSESKSEDAPQSDDLTIKAKLVLDALNQKTGKAFKYTDSNLRLIEARLKDYTVEDCLKVIGIKCSQWKNDPQMNKYLRPETLFNATKFGGYLNEQEVKTSPQYTGYANDEEPFEW